MPKLRLTSRGVESLKAPTKQTDYWDTSLTGFGLRISADGLKTWFVRYRYLGRRPRLKLGTYPALSLANARELAQSALHEAAIGSDPAAVKATDRAAPTFAFLAAEYLERHAKPNKKSWLDDDNKLQREILPLWGQRKAKDIQRKDVLSLLDATVNRGAPVHANRLFALIRKIFKFGIERDLVQASPCTAISRPTREHARERVLNPSEIRALWAAIEKQPVLTAALFKLHLLTGQRGAEIRSMEWSEVDRQTGWWTIPGSKTKNGLDHRVFLAPQAQKIVRSLPATKPGSRWMFPSTTVAGQHINNIQKAAGRLRELTDFDFTPHDLRRTMVSSMTSMGISRSIAKRVINHTERDVTSVYDRHSYDREKQEALIAWANHLDKILNDKNLDSEHPLNPNESTKPQTSAQVRVSA